MVDDLPVPQAPAYRSPVSWTKPAVADPVAKASWPTQSVAPTRQEVAPGRAASMTATVEAGSVDDCVTPSNRPPQMPLAASLRVQATVTGILLSDTVPARKVARGAEIVGATESTNNRTPFDDCRGSPVWSTERTVTVWRPCGTWTVAVVWSPATRPM